MMVSFGRRFGMPRVLTDSQVTPLFFSDGTLASRPELVERVTRAGNGFPREGVARAALAVLVHRRDILANIDVIRVPTLVICGAEDRATELMHSQRIAERITGAKLVVIQGAGHLSALEQPDAVNEALVPFVRENLA
jgi:3-oxoadipate enol-lactonase